MNMILVRNGSNLIIYICENVYKQIWTGNEMIDVSNNTNKKKYFF